MKGLGSWTLSAGSSATFCSEESDARLSSTCNPSRFQSESFIDTFQRVKWLQMEANR
jgi:hypothetical protein